MQRIIKSGVKTRVLMLSATPVNNRLADLKNQIAFVTEGVDSIEKPLLEDVEARCDTFFAVGRLADKAAIFDELQVLLVVVCHSAGNIDPLSRGIGVQN